MGSDLSNLFELLKPWLIGVLVSATAAVLVSAFWFGVYFLLIRIALRGEVAWSRSQRLIGWLIVSVIAGSVVWSIWFESLLPYLRAGRYKEFLITAAGILGMLLGTGLVFYGGAKSLRSIFTLYGDEEFLQMLAAAKAKRSPTTVRRARLKNLLTVLGMLWRAWAPGAGWLMIGLGLMIGPAGYLSDFDLGLDVTRLTIGLGLMALGGLLCLIFAQ
ncbi:MAG: hypothetical protein J7M16_01470 [Anaerolineae bacterium]|nr:hypothetical protein [Anaerolineae bacterium]